MRGGHVKIFLHCDSDRQLTELLFLQRYNITVRNASVNLQVRGMITSKETQKRGGLLQMPLTCSFELQMLLGSMLGRKVPAEPPGIRTQHTNTDMYTPVARLRVHVRTYSKEKRCFSLTNFKGCELHMLTNWCQRTDSTETVAENKSWLLSRHGCAVTAGLPAEAVAVGGAWRKMARKCFRPTYMAAGSRPKYCRQNRVSQLVWLRQMRQTTVQSRLLRDQIYKVLPITFGEVILQHM